MFRIIFKGGMEDLYLDEIQGRKLMDDLQNDRLDGFINLSGKLVEVKSIKAILPDSVNPDSQDKKKQLSEEMQKDAEKFKVTLEELWALPLEVRARELGLAEVVFMGVGHKQMTEQEKEQVIQRQFEFYKEHPDYAFANPVCYKDLLPKSQIRFDGGMLKLSDSLPETALIWAQRLVLNGIKQ